MKKYTQLFLVLITLITFFSITQSIFARVTPTPTPSSTPTPTPNNLEQQINNLKDKIASRVAQLNLVEKKGIIGTVTDVNSTQITVNDIHGNEQFIDVDELTKFSSPSAKASFGISDITKGTQLGILGLYNKQSKRILARFVDVLILPTYISGAVSDLDKTNYIVTLQTVDKKSYSIDIENVTKTYAYDGTTTLSKSGFSKITTGERITVIGFPDIKDAKHIIASRILLFPTLPIDPAIQLIKPQSLDLQGTVVPSTGSGVKLTPLTH